MKNGSISSQREKLNRIQSLIAEYGRDNEEKLVHFILSQRDIDTGRHYTMSDVARALDVTPQAIHDRYPKIKGGKSE